MLTSPRLKEEKLSTRKRSGAVIAAGPETAEAAQASNQSANIQEP